MTYYEISKHSARIYRAIFNWHRERYDRKAASDELAFQPDKKKLREMIKRPTISIFPASNLIVINAFTVIEYTIRFSALPEVAKDLAAYKEYHIKELLTA